jgi:hypothetical protein
MISTMVWDDTREEQVRGLQVRVRHTFEAVSIAGPAWVIILMGSKQQTAK